MPAARPTRHVVLVGAYGIRNAGDDAPLLVLADGLRAAYPDVDFRFTVIARHPDRLMARAAKARYVRNPEYASRAAARGKWFRGFNHGDDTRDLARIEALVRRADVVVAGAGNVLIDIALDLFRGPIPLLATYAFLCDLHRTPLMLYGVSAGPLATRRGRDGSAWIARRAHDLTVRDAASRDLLAELAPESAVTLLPDPVLGLRPCTDGALARALVSEGIPGQGERPRLALALRDLGFLGFDRGVLVDALRVLGERFELLFVPQCTDRDDDDRAEASAVARALGPRVVCHRVTRRHPPDVVMRFYEGADATLAIRLHGAVFSAMRGVPVSALVYLPKVAAFLESVGARDMCVPLEKASPAAIVEAVERATPERGRALALRCRELADVVPGYTRIVGARLGLGEPAAGADRAA